ncbi:hypothetical protein TNCV_2964451 [Trichonephila clavipes]|nr:hypothetical protein TNCV_2964451 [Trichonephila clavipes]
MAFRAISVTPGQNIIFIDFQAEIKTVSGYNQNLSSSANNLLTHFLAPEERSFFNGSHPITAFVEINKPTSWPKRLRRCIHLAFRYLFETPSDFSEINFDRKNIHSYRAFCWRILVSSARWPKTCSAFCPT